METIIPVFGTRLETIVMDPILTLSKAIKASGDGKV